MESNGAPRADEAGYARARPNHAAESLVSRPSIAHRLTQVRLASLIALTDARLRSLRSMRFARFVGLLIIPVFALPMAIVARHGGEDVLDAVALRGLAWLSFGAAGVAALGAAGDLAGQDRADGVLGLALRRGYGPSELSLARLLATIWRIAVVTGTPALVLCGVALGASGAGPLLWRRAALLLAVVGYVALLAAVLGGLARWSASVSPKRGRWLLSVLVLGPELAHELWESVPGVIDTFGWLSHQLLQLGAGVA